MMTEREFLGGLTGRADDLERVVAALRASGHPFCLIGGLAINHYVEPVATLDAGFAVVAADGVAETLQAQGFNVEHHAHSINSVLPGNRLRIQITTDERYRDFTRRAADAEVFGCRMPVASLDDLVRSKVRAAADPQRRLSKRKKDKLDLLLICEAYPAMRALIPSGLVPELDQTN